MGLEYTARLVASMQAMGVAGRRRRVPNPVHPMGIETDYGTRIAAIVRTVMRSYERLRTEMPRLLGATASTFEVRRDVGEAEFAKQLLDEARAKMLLEVKPEAIAALATLAGERTSIAQRADLARQIKAGLGVDVQIDESRTRDILKYFALENAQKIGSIPAKLHEDIANLTMTALSKRMTVETFAERIQKIAEVTEGKARQLAADQIGSLTGNLSEIRQAELGITHYIWITRRDNLVRPAHRAREGVRFPWARAPVGGHPGADYGCRCTAKPDLSGVLAAIEKTRAHSRPIIGR